MGGPLPSTTVEVAIEEAGIVEKTTGRIIAVPDTREAIVGEPHLPERVAGYESDVPNGSQDDIGAWGSPRMFVDATGETFPITSGTPPHRDDLLAGFR